MGPGSSDTLSIGMVAAQLGVSTATLRKWEERYGVPRPLRLASGTRRYPRATLKQLQRALRLIDGGLSTAEALKLSGQAAAPEVAPKTAEDTLVLEAAYEDLRRDDLVACERRLQLGLSELGVITFIDRLLGPLLHRVGDGWLSGELEVFHEHAVTEMVAGLLRHPPLRQGAPQAGNTVLLATPPDERHALGISMVEAALVAEGASCINLGPELPCNQVLLAAQRFDAGIVGIGLSMAARPRLIQQYLARLRSQLPGNVQLWLGGEGASRLQAMPEGVRYLSSVAEAVQEYKRSSGADAAARIGEQQ